MIPKPTKRGPKPRKPIARKKAPRRSPRAPGGIFLSRRERRKWLKKLADDTFSLIIRVRDHNLCFLCGQDFRVQCAHLVSRRYYTVRWSTENARGLCWPCHARYTFDPLGWDAVCEDWLGAVEWSKLKDTARAGGLGEKVDYEMLVLALPALLRQQIHESGLPQSLNAQIEKLEARYLKGGIPYGTLRKTG